MKLLLRLVPKLLAPAAAALLLASPLPAQPQDAHEGARSTAPQQAAGTTLRAEAAEIDALAAALRDPEARARLLRQLELLRGATAQVRDDPAAGGLQSRAGRLAADLVAGTSVLFSVSQAAAWLRDQAASPEARRTWLDFLWKLALILAAAILIRAATRRLLAAPRAAVEGQQRESAWTRLPFLAVRMILDLLPVAAFAAAGYVLLALLEPREFTRIIALATINAAVAASLVIAAGRTVLAPRAANLRVVGLGDESANYLMAWVRRFAMVGAAGYFLAEASLTLGLVAGAHMALTRIIGLVFALLAMIFVLQNRDAVGAWLRGPEGSGFAGLRLLRRRFADIWHVLAVIYLGAVYAVWMLGIPGGFAYVLQASAISLAIVIAAKLLIIAAHRILDHVFGLRADIIARYPALAARADRYFAILHVAATAIVTVLAALAALEAWGIEAFAWIATDAGRGVIGAAVSIAVVVAAAALFWEVASAMIERQLTGDREPGARARTLLPLLRRTLLIVTVTVSGFVVLSEIGVDIGPLLAGAGVVGLAVGFGAQTLVKDVITGFFILAEDQFAAGDVISVSGITGTVEDITIRTIRLRDLGGNVHVLPFSSVSTVTNMTKDYSQHVFDIGVAYREDVDEVIGALSVIGEELRADPAFGPVVREPLEIMGLDALADSAVVIRGRITTDPGMQWSVGREFNRRVKRRFDELGIEIPFPHQTVYFGEDKSGRAPAASVRLEEARPPQPADQAPAARSAAATTPGALQPRTPDAGDGGD